MSDAIKYGVVVLGGDVDTGVTDEDGSFCQVVSGRWDDEGGVV